jgi:predicted HAD superfamily phosphohydrolase YqeG
MNRTSWERILKKYSESIGVGKEGTIVSNTARYRVSIVSREIDEDFIILENKDGSGLAAIVELEEVAGFRTH